MLLMNMAVHKNKAKVIDSEVRLTCKFLVKIAALCKILTIIQYSFVVP